MPFWLETVTVSQFQLLLCKRMFIAWFQASSEKQIWTALFWVITQRVVAISPRRFRTTNRSHPQVGRDQ